MRFLYIETDWNLICADAADEGGGESKLCGISGRRMNVSSFQRLLGAIGIHWDPLGSIGIHLGSSGVDAAAGLTT